MILPPFAMPNWSQRARRNWRSFFWGCLVMLVLEQFIMTDNSDDILLKKHRDRTSLRKQVDTTPDSRNYLNQPIDTHHYPSLHNPKWRCRKKTGRKANVFLLFLVSSAPGNFYRREAIRSTIGNRSEWEPLYKAEVRVAFLLGATRNSTKQRMIHREFNFNHDLIQERFVDSDLNATIKTVMGLKWFSRYCNHARYMMKIDDHSVVNQRNIHALLTNASAHEYVAAQLVVGEKVARTKKNKTFLSKEFYPQPTFPPFMAGPIYILSSGLVEEVADVATRIPTFPLEDVFMGMCLHKLGVEIVDQPDFLVRIDTTYDMRQKEEAVLNSTVISNVLAKEMKWIWSLGRVRGR